ncbi:MAG: hypothetical protein DCC88_05320 [Spirobacillus cienkowskii]|jgi:guanyl-specific ribonuclease Sa|uniref:Uncharacterized protein n=1 Tax=Spirobacillus cienkowskii TaxID=495820 RepID=A0A369KS48_9BACT|nr:MAG: hypothetical protein DCC88_05320 [Spirobacillus cienkowskii]
MFFKRKLGNYTTSVLYSLLAGISLQSYGLSNQIYCTNSENHFDQKKLSTIPNFSFETLFTPESNLNLNGKATEFKTIQNEKFELFEVLLPRHYRELDLKNGLVKNFLNEIENKLLNSTEERISLKRLVNVLKNQVFIEDITINLFLDKLTQEINEKFDEFYKFDNFSKLDIENIKSKISIFVADFKHKNIVDIEQLDNYTNYLLSELEIPNSHLYKIIKNLPEKDKKDVILTQLRTPNSKLLNHLKYVKNLLPLSKQQKEKIRNKIKQELENYDSQLNLHLEKIREKLFDSHIIHDDVLEEYLAAYPRTHSDRHETQYYYQIETKKLNSVCAKLISTCTQSFGTKFSIINAHSFNYNNNKESKWLPVKINNSVCSNFSFNNNKNLNIPAKIIIDNLISELIFENLFSVSFNNLTFHKNIHERGLPSRNKNSGSSQSTTCALKPSADETFKDDNNNEPATDNDGWSVAYRKSPIPERFIYKALEIVDKLKTRDRSVLKQGKMFKNHEKRLPNGGYYYEFDVVCEEQRGRRDAKRLVININNLQWWYTKDHYQSFVFDSQKDKDIVERVIKGSKQ